MVTKQRKYLKSIGKQPKSGIKRSHVIGDVTDGELAGESFFTSSLKLAATNRASSKACICINREIIFLIVILKDKPLISDIDRKRCCVKNLLRKCQKSLSKTLALYNLSNNPSSGHNI